MKYEAVVIGGGHAGIEASLAIARMGHKTLLVTLNLGAIAMMPCNPSIGGTGKGHLVREVDALGGEMGVCADKALLQIKMLNRAKGPAVYSLRAQADRKLYSKIMLETLRAEPNLTLMEGEVSKILTAGDTVTGVELAGGERIQTRAVVLCTGVYLNGKLITGTYTLPSGPYGETRATLLTSCLKDLNLPMRRFKTGTPARIYRDSIDFSLMEPQYGEEGLKFSFMTKEAVANRECCYLTYTNERTHEIIKENIHRAPMYNGAIEGIGPRYCPSIEDKVMRFKDKERHQIFVEPEGYQSEEMYIQGMSTSLPHDVQEKMYRTIKGLEKARFARYAYAIEYDCIEPQSLSPALAIKGFGGLFSAGQFNGTSGYEEAAAQGIIAGINAARYLEDKDYYIPTRDTSYIGVLIDDIVTKGTKEPYRMMTSRAEHRIILRQDNADMRLTEIAYNLGLATFERYQRLNLKKAEMARIEKLAKKPLEKSDALIRIFERGGEELPQRITLMELMKRAFVTLDDLIELCPDAANDTEALEAVFIEKKYEGYVKKQEAAIAEQRRLENKQLPEDIDYLKIDGLRLEARQKLNAVRPLNLGQASRISGVSPADISVLIVYLQKHGL